MTSAQKIIKYIATAFAILLVVTIISAILSGSYALLSSLGLISKNENVITENLETISGEVSEVSSLTIDLDYTNLYIKAGEKFEVQTNNSKITFENNDGSVKIKEKNKQGSNNKNEENDVIVHMPSFSDKSAESNLIVYIPENMLEIDETNIDTGVGRIKIEKLNTKGLYLNLGAGEVDIENVLVSENVDIDGGVGETELKHCQLNNLKADFGIGEFEFNGTITGRSEINSGVGAIALDLTGKKEDYTINTSKGLGEITLDGKTVEGDSVYGTGANYLEIDGGVGSVEIEFEEE